MKKYKLTAADGTIYESEIPGLLGGHRPNKTYGRLDCATAISHLPNYAKNRVFFADEDAAIAAGYRPCGKCMKDTYEKWKTGGELGTIDYPWLQKSKPKTE